MVRYGAPQCINTGALLPITSMEMTIMVINDSTTARFWAKVNKSGNCWLWTAAHTPAGYGTLKINGKYQYAHRISWTIHNGSIPDDLCVLHACDNPPCVRPDHLWLGTYAENNADMAKKGRSRTKDQKGEANGQSKLTNSDVLQIRRKYAQGNILLCQLGSQFNVTPELIGMIIKRQRWTHL